MDQSRTYTLLENREKWTDSDDRDFSDLTDEERFALEEEGERRDREEGERVGRELEVLKAVSAIQGAE